MSEAKIKAKELFNEHYMVLFDSDSDKGEEILVSLLAHKAALITAKECLNLAERTISHGLINFWNLTIKEIEKL